MRGKPAPRRSIAPDPRFGNLLVERLIRSVMKNGKKSVAQSIVYSAFDMIQEKTKKEPIIVFDEAVKNVSPAVEVRSRRIGGANYQIPMEVRGDRKIALAFRWILDAARSRHGAPMKTRLAEEIINAANREGSAIKKKEDVHRMAEANRAFAHFARR